MTKRDEANRLFSKGSTVDSAEIMELGLAESTVERYYRDWKRGLQVEEDIKPSLVPVSSLQPRQLFEFQGFQYRLDFFKRDQAHVLLVEWHPSGQYQIEQCGRYLPPDTLVKAT